MSELTKEQAIALADSGFWESMTSREIAEFQMNTRRLCMPFNVFHKALEETLGRPVFIHELAFDEIKKELRGEADAPTLKQIIGLIPANKRIIVDLSEEAAPTEQQREG